MTAHHPWRRAAAPSMDDFAALAEEAFARLPAQFRALVTDVELKSKLTGWDVARHARTITPELPVIYATSTAHDWEALGVPNSLLITKPFAPAQIVTAVAQLLNEVPKIAP